MFPQNDGSIVLGGQYMPAGFYICKENTLGNIVWGHGYSEGTASADIRDMIPTADGGYMIIGLVYFTDTNFTVHNSGSGYADIGVMKLDSLGNKQWSKAIGGINDEKAAKAISIPGGGYYIFGATMSDDGDCTGNHGAADAYLARLDDTGHIIWHNDLGGTGDDGGGGQNSGYAMADGNGGIIMATVSGSEDGDVTHPLIGSSIWLIDIDSSNNIVWNNCFGGGGQEFPTSVCMATDGSIWIAGQSVVKGGEVDTSYGGSSDAWIVHADNTGNFINAKVLGSTGQDAGEMIYPLSNGSVITGGYYENGNGSFNIDWGEGGGGTAFLAIFSPWTEGIQQISNTDSIKVYPDPATDLINISVQRQGYYELSIYDILGRLVYDDKLNKDIQIQVSDWQSGLYIIKIISTDGSSTTKKIIVQ